MSSILVALLLTVSSCAQASIAYIQRDAFSCSNGKSYDIARHYAGGWGPGSWKLIALCKLGTLKQEAYNGRYVDPKEASPELARCMEDESRSIIACYDEFVKLNGRSGPGDLPPIKTQEKEKK